MPLATVSGRKVYYEIHGDAPGTPLVLVMGMAGSCKGWLALQVPDFASHHRTLIYENRGVGESEDPGGPIQVTAQEFAFNPTRIEITAGEEVTIEMTNRDEGVTHNFHVIAGSVDEALPTFTPADGPQSLTFTIEAAGTYEFRCDVHPTTMIGALVVTE